MTTMWERLAQRNSLYEREDYERAAYRLVTQQVLSVNDPATRKDYYLVSEHLKEYQQAVDPLGITLRHDSQLRYLVAQPRHLIQHNKASKAVTLLVLVLADIYHRIRFNGQQGDFGEAYVELPDLQAAYEGLTGTELPRVGELRQLMLEVERWGIARRHEDTLDDSQPFQIMIHPAISQIVTREWLSLLEGLGKSTEEREEEGSDVSA